MPKDSKLEEIVLVRDDFNTDEQAEVADRLQQNWPAQFTELEAKFDDYSRSTYQKVYNEYFGDANDPITPTRTVEELRDEYGKIRRYKDMRDAGQIESNSSPLEGLTDQYQQGYLEGWKEGYGEGFKDGAGSESD